MKEFQIEKVEHDIFNTYLSEQYTAFVLIQNTRGDLSQVNFFDCKNAHKYNVQNAVGKWRIKQQNLK